ncbi:MAG: hypothetical protein DMG57_36125 [Acidobacteria bacterium]|nr:MAG: hypothetical protein DMG57_36125 [Acidobacteriota bacterium]
MLAVRQVHNRLTFIMSVHYGSLLLCISFFNQDRAEIRHDAAPLEMKPDPVTDAAFGWRGPMRADANFSTCKQSNHLVQLGCAQVVRF